MIFGTMMFGGSFVDYYLLDGSFMEASAIGGSGICLVAFGVKQITDIMTDIVKGVAGQWIKK